MAIVHLKSLVFPEKEYLKSFVFFADHQYYENEFLKDLTENFYQFIKLNEMHHVKNLMHEDKKTVILFFNFTSNNYLKKFLKLIEPIIDNKDKNFCPFKLEVKSKKLKNQTPNSEWFKTSVPESDLDDGTHYMEFDFDSEEYA